MKRTIINNEDFNSVKVGVGNAYECIDYIYDLIDGGFDLNYEEYILGLKEQGKTEEQIEELLYEYENDTCNILFGDWKKNEDGKYEIDKAGQHGFAATYSNSNGSIYCVEYSKHLARCHHTSPCYVQADGSGPCGDLDTCGGYLAYSLPPDYYKAFHSLEFTNE